MTELRLGSKLTRKTSAIVQRRTLIVTLFPGYLDIRQERTRKPLSVSWDAIYRYAARLFADKERAEKQLAKKGKK